MIQPFEARSTPERALIVSPRLDQILFLVLLALAFSVRVVNLNYNTLFVDEAIYATVGRDLLAGTEQTSALGWMYGSYLYPLMAGVVNQLGGEIGLRLMSVVLSTLAVLLTYLTTVRLFGGETAIWATLIFSFTAISVNMGQFAVYDAPVIPALAATFYLIVRASEAPPRAERLLLAAAALCLVVAVLGKYFAALFLPALCCVGLACALQQGRSLRPFVSWFLLPMVVLVGAYALVSDDELRNLLAGDYGVDLEARTLILRELWAEIGVTTLMALAGLGLLAWRGLPVAMKAPRWRRRLWAVLIPALALSALAAPLYHLMSGNSQSAWKHTIYSLIFLAPLAGYSCASLVSKLRELPLQRSQTVRLIGALLSALLVAWGLNYAIDRNWGFQNSWPDAGGVVAHLRNAELAPTDAVLAEGAHIYDYYLGAPGTISWTNTWYAEYDGLTGVDAMAAAIADHTYRFVVLDGFYTPELRERLETAALQAGYTLDYQEAQQLSRGMSVQLSVYKAPTR